MLAEGGDTPSPKQDNVHDYFAENRAQKGHGRQSLRGGAVSLIARAINGVVQVVSVLFLARLLTPEDYGLVTMVTTIVGFAPLVIDLGTRDAVVQRPHITASEVSALFWLTIGVGLTFMVLIVASGPLIARFYHEPRLATITPISSLIIIASALTFQHQALMRRAMMFRKIAIIEVSANVLGAAAAIAMAFHGFAYWALVARPIITSFLTAVGVWVGCRWLPVKPTITAGVREMVKFGCNLIGFSLTDFTSKNMDRIAIGSRFGPRGLGLYQNALLIYDNLLDLTFPLHGVAVVSLSKLLHNLEELRRSWAKALSTLAFYAMPAFGILAVTSQDVILLLGKKWESAGILLSVLALRGIPHVVERTFGPVVAVGHFCRLRPGRRAFLWFAVWSDGRRHCLRSCDIPSLCSGHRLRGCPVGN